jgi:hypothetical protein
LKPTRDDAFSCGIYVCFRVLAQAAYTLIAIKLIVKSAAARGRPIGRVRACDLPLFAALLAAGGAEGRRSGARVDLQPQRTAQKAVQGLA